MTGTFLNYLLDFFEELENVLDTVEDSTVSDATAQSETDVTLNATTISGQQKKVLYGGPK
jgi:hypothetical protein